MFSDCHCLICNGKCYLLDIRFDRHIWESRLRSGMWYCKGELASLKLFILNFEYFLYFSISLTCLRTYKYYHNNFLFKNDLWLPTLINNKQGIHREIFKYLSLRPVLSFHLSDLICHGKNLKSLPTYVNIYPKCLLRYMMCQETHMLVNHKIFWISGRHMKVH